MRPVEKFGAGAGPAGPTDYWAWSEKKRGEKREKWKWTKFVFLSRHVPLHW